MNLPILALGRLRISNLAATLAAAAVLLASGMLLFTALPEEASAQTTPTGPLLRFACGVAKTEAIDPIAHTYHRHIFFGNRSVEENSTGESLAASTDTTCSRDFATSSYWVPVVKDQDGRLKIRTAVVYYTDKRDQSKVEDIPRGLELIGSEEVSQVSFGCGGPANMDDPPATCTESEFRIAVKFPDCWNGSGLSPSNSVYRDEEPCPDTHPRQLPNVRLLVIYNAGSDGVDMPLTVSTGDGQYGPVSTMHGDVLHAAQEPAFSEALDRCVRSVGDTDPAPTGCREL
jgi:hypothetical protein